MANRRRPVDIGATHGLLTVIGRGVPGNPSAWVCVCVCGQQVARMATQLLSGRKVACQRCKSVGRTHSDEQRQKISASKLGGLNPNWKAGYVSVQGGRLRARLAIPNLGACERCGRQATDRHHKDADTTNNSPENLSALCRRCHMTVDGRLDRFMSLERTPATGDRNGSRTKPWAIIRGENHRWAKLAQEQVDEIRRLRSDGRKLLELSMAFGVSFQSISKICRGQRWKEATR